eukprot:9019096-Pyramimonas_sp.AAC.1
MAMISSALSLGKGRPKDPVGVSSRALSTDATEPIAFSLGQRQRVTDNASRRRERRRRGPGLR